MNDPHTAPNSRARLWWEIIIVLALSFGTSALYAIVTIIERVTRDVALNEQTATINRALSERPLLDLSYQLLNIFSALAPVALVIWLTWRARRPHTAALGLGAPIVTPHQSQRSRSTQRWWVKETSAGIGLAALIGIPGIGLYLVSKAFGLNVTVVPTALDAYVWTVPVLVLLALNAALGEELVVVAYLFNRLRTLGFAPAAIILASALLRATYHLYQGFGGFVGNFVMGLVFGWAYNKYGRALPLIVAHWVLDIVSFVGYPLAVALWPALFGAPATT